MTPSAARDFRIGGSRIVRFISFPKNLPVYHQQVMKKMIDANVIMMTLIKVSLSGCERKLKKYHPASCCLIRTPVAMQPFRGMEAGMTIVEDSRTLAMMMASVM